MDNRFELEDGSVAVIDYESEYKKSNFTKYGRYLMDVADRYLKEGEEPDIHMMIPGSKGRKSDASLLARGFLTLGPAKNMKK